MDFIIKTYDHKEKVIAYIQRLPLDKNNYKAKIEAIKGKRSNQQNRYAHFVFNMIAEETGEFMPNVKWFYRQLFLTVVEKIFDKEIERVRSTTELTTLEQEDFMTKVRTHAGTELNMFIPLPNEVIYDDEF